MSRRVGGSVAAVLLLWLALLLTIAFHGYGSGTRRRWILHHNPPAAFHRLPTTARKILLAVASFDASSSPASSTSTAPTDDHRDHHHHHHHHQHHNHHDHRWNRQGVSPAEEVDPRFGVHKRLVPTGPNPLHH